MLDRLTIDHFSKRVNETFALHIEGMDAFTLELIEVSPLGSAPADTMLRRAFSVIFRGPAEPVLLQQIYHLTHAEMDDLTLFLVPIGPDRTGGIRYEAVFT